MLLFVDWSFGFGGLGVLFRGFESFGFGGLRVLGSGVWGFGVLFWGGG